MIYVGLFCVQACACALLREYVLGRCARVCGRMNRRQKEGCEVGKAATGRPG